MLVSSSSGGGVLSQSQYEAFGTHTDYGNLPQDKYRANTKVEDHPGELLYEGRRFRHLTQGRFIMPDPLEYVDGLNCYAYCNNNPWGRFDPTGLYSFKDFRNDVSAHYEALKSSINVEFSVGLRANFGAKITNKFALELSVNLRSTTFQYNIYSEDFSLTTNSDIGININAMNLLAFNFDASSRDGIHTALDSNKITNYMQIDETKVGSKLKFLKYVNKELTSTDIISESKRNLSHREAKLNKLQERTDFNNDIEVGGGILGSVNIGIDFNRYSRTLDVMREQQTQEAEANKTSEE